MASGPLVRRNMFCAIKSRIATTSGFWFANAALTSKGLHVENASDDIGALGGRDTRDQGKRFEKVDDFEHKARILVRKKLGHVMPAQ